MPFQLFKFALPTALFCMSFASLYCFYASGLTINGTHISYIIMFSEYMLNIYSCLKTDVLKTKQVYVCLSQIIFYRLGGVSPV